MAKQDDWVRLQLRLPKDLHERLLKASATRSLNAEILQRLERSFSFDEVYDALAEELRKQEVAKMEANPPGSAAAPEVYVTLDTDGRPIAWDEIVVHLDGIRAELPGVVGMNTRVITPELALQEDADSAARADAAARFYSAVRVDRRLGEIARGKKGPPKG